MKILFVCTGNSCRSPMAELYFNHLARERAPEIQAFSAGIYAYDGSPVSSSAKAVMQEQGIDVSQFASTAFTPKRAEEYDLLVGMTRTHAALMGYIAPEAKSKVRTLIPGGDVPDPYGGSVDDYRRVFDLMRPYLEQLLTESYNPTQGEKE